MKQVVEARTQGRSGNAVRVTFKDSVPDLVEVSVSGPYRRHWRTIYRRGKQKPMTLGAACAVRAAQAVLEQQINAFISSTNAGRDAMLRDEQRKNDSEKA